MTISACFIVLNEQDNIQNAVLSVTHVVDEIIIGVDSRTTDNTIQVISDIPTTTPIKTLLFDWQESFSVARNYTKYFATRDWILTLDADEELTDYGRTEIVKASQFVDQAFATMEFDISESGNGSIHLTNIKLFPNTSDWQWIGRVHEQVCYIGIGHPQVKIIEPGWCFIHTGYSTENKLVSKLERNLALLLMEEEATPQLYYHLARTYKGLGNYTLASREAYKALEGNQELSISQRAELIQIVNPQYNI